MDDPKFNSSFTKCFKYDSDKISEKDNPSLDVYIHIIYVLVLTKLVISI